MNTSTRSTFNLGALGEAVRQGVLTDKDLLDIGKAVGAQIGRRIRTGLTALGDQLDENEEGYRNWKASQGYVTEPLQQTGRMTEPDAWDVSVSRDSITLELNPEHREKWDTIVEIAQTFDKNWDTAFDIGELEQATALLYASDAIEKNLRLER